MATVRYVPESFYQGITNTTMTRKIHSAAGQRLKTVLSSVQDAIVILQEAEVELLLSLTDNETSILERRADLWEPPYHLDEIANGKRKSRGRSLGAKGKLVPQGRARRPARHKPSGGREEA